MTPTALEETQSSRGWANPVRRPVFRKLKPGPGRAAEDVIANQCARLRRAMIELVAERGYTAVTVRELSRTAGVSTRTFYKHFANAEECFASTSESLMEAALQRAIVARETAEGPEQELRGGIEALMDDLAQEPKAGHLALVDSFAGGPDLRERMPLAAREFELLLLDTLAEAPGKVAAALRVGQGMVAGATHVARTTLRAGRGAELPDLAGEIADWMLSLRVDPGTDLDDGAPAVDTESSGNRMEKRELLASLLGGIGDERGRVLSVVARLGASIDYEELTVPRIRAEAGVSRRSFDAEFTSVEDCFLETIEVLATTIAERAARRAIGADSWELGVRRASFALCVEIARHPALAKLGLIDILAPGLAGLQCRERLLALGADRLQDLIPAEHQPSRLAAEASTAAAWRILQAEVATGRERQLPGVAPTVAHVLLAPSLGPRDTTRADAVER